MTMPAPISNAARPAHFVKPLESEHDFVPLRVDGRIPPDLRGTFYRNAPARYDSGSRPHWFDGSGAITAVRLDQGQALGAVKRIHSPSIDSDSGRRANRFGGFRQPISYGRRLRALLGGQAVRNLANINLLPWQGRLFALYETTLPVEINPLTLATIGETDLGLIPKAWNAHPRRVASRHTVYQFGVRIGAKVMLDVFALPSSGAAQLLTSLPLPGAMEVHDFFATDNHLVFVLAPLWCASLELLRNGSFVEALRWQPDAPTTVLIIPLAAPQAVQRIETEPFFFWHGVNAYERSAGRELVLDLVRYPDFAATKIPLDILSDGGSAPPSHGTLWRGVIDLVDRRVAWEERWPAFCEFPAVHKDRQGREYGQAWLASYNTLGQSQWYDTLSCVDLNEGRSRDIFVGNGCEVSEPGLVARSGDEGEVYVLSLIHDNSAAASWLGIWDGASTSDEPLARVWFDQLLPRPLHGCWMPAA